MIVRLRLVPIGSLILKSLLFFELFDGLVKLLLLVWHVDDLRVGRGPHVEAAVFVRVHHAGLRARAWLGWRFKLIPTVAELIHSRR